MDMYQDIKLSDENDIPVEEYLNHHATGMEQADVLLDGKETILRPNMTLNVLLALFVPGMGGPKIEDNR